MNVFDTTIHDVKLIEPKLFGDDRGFFLETFQAERYQEQAGIQQAFIQDNHSRSRKGVLRGLHFQKTKPQGKLVRVVSGEVFDVAVDIRRNSPDFGKWFGAHLSAENCHQLWIPPGLAHGFLVLSDVADFEYKCTEYYYPEDEGCLIWNDRDVNIKWPSNDVQLSSKDQLGKTLKEL